MSIFLPQENPSNTYVIDEIGKMELFSQSFIQIVRDTLNRADTTVLATIPVPKGRPIPFVEEVRSRKDVVVFNVSKANRDAILDDIIKAVKDSIQVYNHG
ncbi:hypothetical protein FSP39_005063 [Pinctada imbricata]|uniref:Uncharacterized protein n=1 Tax=Pinctada imbricata TaxID=66713 RepID=A0AA89BSG2_PINIB|nr:hypothetical protein FSP39_005063 [Pinctada imbricata]